MLRIKFRCAAGFTAQSVRFQIRNLLLCHDTIKVPDAARLLRYSVFPAAATALACSGNGNGRSSNEMITLPRKMRVERDSKYFRTSFV